YEAAGIAYIGEVGEEAHALDELDAGFEAALDAEGEDGARPFRQVFLRELVIRAGFEPGVGNPGDALVAGEKLGDLLRILDVAVHPDVQAFDPGQGEEGVHRRERRTEIPERHRAGLGGKGE